MIYNGYQFFNFLVVSERFGTFKSLGTGIGKIWYQKSLRKIWNRKKYQYRYQKYLVPDKSIGIGIVQHFGYRVTLTTMCPITITTKYAQYSLAPLPSAPNTTTNNYY